MGIKERVINDKFYKGKVREITFDNCGYEGKLSYTVKRYCAVCGCPMKRTYRGKENTVFYDPVELLCDYHKTLVNFIMDGFQKIRGKTNWYGISSEFGRGAWREWIRNNMFILLEAFNEDRFIHMFYGKGNAPSDYCGPNFKQRVAT